MTSPINDELKKNLAKLEGEAARLKEELARVQELIRAMKKALGVGRASPGGLKEAIMGVLSKSPMSNGDIRETLETAGYPHALTRDIVSRALTDLNRDGKVRRTGDKTNSRYVRSK